MALKAWHVAAALGVFFLFLLLVLSVGYGGSTLGECVGVIRVSGEITAEKQGGLGGGAVSSDELKELVSQAESDSSIKSVLYVINSPGGSPVASKEIYDALRESTKPKVAYLSEIAASGGYYVASASDYIIANPNTLTGSIGARADFLNYEELFQKIGLRENVIKSGEMKDIGAGYRNLTEDEKRLLTQIVGEAADNFKKDVLATRGAKVSGNALFEQALEDARPLSANQALRAGLVDEIGNGDAALAKAGALGGISFEKLPEKCELAPPQPSLLDFFSSLGSEIGKGIASQLGVSQNHAGVSYR